MFAYNNAVVTTRRIKSISIPHPLIINNEGAGGVYRLTPNQGSSRAADSHNKHLGSQNEIIYEPNLLISDSRKNFARNPS